LAELSSPILLLLLIAPAVGSFLNVLIDRLPRGEDVIRVPSGCRSCGQRLGLRDLVPVLSFVALRGRCRHCGSAISPWHFYVEIAAPGLAVLAVLAAPAGGGGGTVAWLTALVLWTLLALAVTDLIWFRLPNPLTLTLVGLALTLALAQALADPAQTAQPAQTALLRAFGGAVLGAGSFWLLRLSYAALRGREGLGAGDVKLMAGIGALTGAAALPVVVLTGALLALTTALVVARLSGRALTGTLRLPFGAALCAAGFLVWLWQAAAI